MSKIYEISDRLDDKLNFIKNELELNNKGEAIQKAIEYFQSIVININVGKHICILSEKDLKKIKKSEKYIFLNKSKLNGN